MGFKIDLPNHADYRLLMFDFKKNLSEWKIEGQAYLKTDQVEDMLTYEKIHQLIFDGQDLSKISSPDEMTKFIKFISKMNSGIDFNINIKKDEKGLTVSVDKQKQNLSSSELFSSL